MRAVVVVVALLAGCPADDSMPRECTDTSCGGDVCARDGECLPANEVRAVKTTWTIDGMAASMTTCAPIPNLHIYFRSTGDSFGFDPVPCDQGQFFVDKLPLRFDEVDLGADGHFELTAFIDPQTLTTTFNLHP
jgi:hypothetical protein